MEDEIVTYETAVLAKEKGFDIWQVNDMFYDPSRAQHSIKDGGRILQRYYALEQPPHFSREHFDQLVKAPTQAMLQRWLREVHNIAITIDTNAAQDAWFWWARKQGWSRLACSPGNVEKDSTDTYELALEAALVAALKIITKTTT